MIFEWASSPWWIEVLMGLGIACTLELCSIFLTEERFGHSGWFLVGQLLLAAGVVSLFWGDFDFGVPHGLALTTAFVLHVGFWWLVHAVHRSKVERRTRWFWIFQRVQRRDGYFVDKGLSDNALNTRFGLTLLGRKSGKTVWQWLTGHDGWSDTQRGAILRHEFGHTLFALPMMLAEVCVFYFLWMNVARFELGSFLAPLAAFAAITLLSWAEELLADFLSGPAGFSLLEALFGEATLLDYLLGGTGYGSHPPVLLRLLAYGLPVILFIVGVWLLLSL